MSEALKGKKLFVCTTEVVYYALAENESEALKYLSEAARDADLFRADYGNEITTVRECVYEGGWDQHSGVYGKDTDGVTLGECFEAVKELEQQADFESRQGQLFPDGEAK